MGKPFALSGMRRFGPGSAVAAQMLRRWGAPISASTAVRLSRGLCVIYFHVDLPSSEEIEMTDAAPWPTQLRLHKDRKTLTIAFDNGESFDLSAEYLRVRARAPRCRAIPPTSARPSRARRMSPFS